MKKVKYVKPPSKESTQFVNFKKNRSGKKKASRKKKGKKDSSFTWNEPFEKIIPPPLPKRKNLNLKPLVNFVVKEKGVVGAFQEGPAERRKNIAMTLQSLVDELSQLLDKAIMRDQIYEAMKMLKKARSNAVAEGVKKSNSSVVNAKNLISSFNQKYKNVSSALLKLRSATDIAKLTRRSAALEEAIDECMEQVVCEQEIIVKEAKELLQVLKQHDLRVSKAEAVLRDAVARVRISRDKEDLLSELETALGLGVTPGLPCVHTSLFSCYCDFVLHHSYFC